MRRNHKLNKFTTCNSSSSLRNRNIPKWSRIIFRGILKITGFLQLFDELKTFVVLVYTWIKRTDWGHRKKWNSFVKLDR